MQEVIKKQLDNAPESKADEKTQVRKSNNFETSVNTTSMESCFGMPTLYIGFCHYQIHQYGSN